MVFSTEDRVLIKVLRQEKGYDNCWIITLLHWRQLWTCMSLCYHGKLCFGRVIENVIKYDLYVKFPWIFAHNVQICAKFSCKNFTDVYQYFEYYAIILGGRFLWTYSRISLLVLGLVFVCLCIFCVFWSLWVQQIVWKDSSQNVSSEMMSTVLDTVTVFHPLERSDS